MRKTISFIISLCLLSAMLAGFAAPAFAAEKDIVADYFPTGKLEAPEAPYFTGTHYEGQATQLMMYYCQTPELQKLALDMQKQGDAFYEQYGIAQLHTFIQIDVKFNDGDWLSERGSWDTLNEDHEIDYGENVRSWNLTFLNEYEKHADNADKLLSFTQSWLTYFEPDNEVNDYFKPFVKAEKDEYGYDQYIFDFTETTITYRIRWCVRCFTDDYTDNEKWIFLTSDWSPETSIGKNGNQQEPKMPEKIEAPVLSEFELKVNEDGSGEIKYFASLHDSVYYAERYQLIVNDGFEPYYIDAQVKINDGEWFTVDVSNSVWLENGYKSSWVSDEQQLKQTDNAWIRVRIADHSDDSGVSEWSNIIGTKTIEGEDSVPSPDGEPSGKPSSPDATEKTKCKLCGICPIQPLGICLFIWLAAILLFIIIVAIIAKSGKKRRR